MGNFGDWHSRRGTLELGTEDTDEQLRQACTTSAEELSASAGHHATDVDNYSRDGRMLNLLM